MIIGCLIFLGIVILCALICIIILLKRVMDLEFYLNHVTTLLTDIKDLCKQHIDGMFRLLDSDQELWKSQIRTEEQANKIFKIIGEKLFETDKEES